MVKKVIESRYVESCCSSAPSHFAFSSKVRGDHQALVDCDDILRGAGKTSLDEVILYNSVREAAHWRD
jgi:hypothetical protein